ncbi:MAG: NUDIX hydrolase [Geminicoccaceae bacterium]|nr:NUDIX hydrolase [Geminicoccaceae bacterium]
MSRSYPQRPIVGVGVVVVHDNKVLLIRRGKPPRQGQWSLPGGAQKLGETVFDAGQREVFEETGLLVDTIEHLAVVDLIERDADGAIRYHYTLVDLLATSPTGEAVADSDATEVAWFTVGEIDTMPLWNETRRIIMLALKPPK